VHLEALRWLFLVAGSHVCHGAGSRLGQLCLSDVKTGISADVAGKPR
jgi:hypothetical protein